MEHVVPADDGLDSCWLWRGARHHYSAAGLFRVAKGGPGAVWPAHRVGWSLEFGPLLGWQRLEPLCENRHCVRGSHWQLVKRSRRRPARVTRYTSERKAELLAFLSRLGIEETARTFHVERTTLARWRRQAMNGAQGEAHA